MTTGWTLHATGRRAREDWPGLLSGPMTAAWADVAGFHITDALPDTPPRATHLWAWTRGCWVRVRLDHQHWWAAALTIDADPSGNFWTAKQSTPVLGPQPILHWPPGAGEVQQRRVDPADSLTRFDMIQLAPIRQTTATFYGTRDTIPAS